MAKTKRIKLQCTVCDAKVMAKPLILDALHECPKCHENVWFKPFEEKSSSAPEPKVVSMVAEQTVLAVCVIAFLSLIVTAFFFNNSENSNLTSGKTNDKSRLSLQEIIEREKKKRENNAKPLVQQPYIERENNEREDNIESLVQQAMDEVQSTPFGRSEVQRLGNKDLALTRFQKQNGISDEIAEAAIKKWIMSHNRNFDWNLEEVKTLCVRFKANSK